MRLWLHQVRTEQRLFWRSREAAFFLFAFPILLFLLLGSVYSGEVDGHPAADVLLAGILAYSVANTALGGLAIYLVIWRELGILKRIRSTPLPAPTYLAAVLASQLLVFALQAVALIAIGVVLFGADLPAAPASLAAALALSAAGFAGLGFAAASLIRSSEGASAVLNLIVLPMAFVSGSFIPRQQYPEFLQTVAEALPLTYVVELVSAVLLDGDAVWEHAGPAAVIALWGAAGIALAARRFSWMPRGR